MNIFKDLLAGALISLIVLAAGCEREKEEPMAGGGNVRASKSYRQHFGAPPTVAEGTCYALVGFYPLAREPEKVSPFPLFLFDNKNQAETVTEQLLHWGEGWDMGGVMISPFPPGTELISLRQEQDLMRVELSSVALDETDAGEQKAILGVLGHTLTQFEGVARVMVVAGGRLFPYQAERGFLPDPRGISPPGPPQLLTVTGTWESGRDHPGEISAYFDRPVTVQSFSLQGEGGNPLAGEYFRSIFNMAVVLHPADPSAIVEGMPLRAAWRVVDALGRRGEGEGAFPLRRVKHP